MSHAKLFVVRSEGQIKQNKDSVLVSLSPNPHPQGPVVVHARRCCVGFVAAAVAGRYMFSHVVFFPKKNLWKYPMIHFT